MNFQMDQKFKDYFKTNLRQVFLYLIDDCNLRCTQCLYKLEIGFQVCKKEIDFEDAVKLISDFREMGAIKLTLMGGEPTLYGIKENNKPLLDLIRISKELGYEYVRIDTNGQFDSELLEKPEFKMLDEITFSIDGPTKDINDPIRGYGSFEKCVKNIKRAKELGYNIDITSCISKEMIKRDENGNLYLDRMIKFAEDIGIDKINFHNLFKTGVPRDYFSGNIDITINDWFRVWEEIQGKVENNEYSIPVRIPQSFTTKEEFKKNPKYYGYCSCKNGSRILAHPNGMIRVCSLMIGTPYGIARYYDNKIVWDDSPTNELLAHKMDEYTPCTNQYKNNKFGKYVPTCVSFKPKQNEMIWKELQWENHRTENSTGKIRTIVAYDDEDVANNIVNFIKPLDYVEIVAKPLNGIDTYNKIVELKPEMVFTKFNMSDMNGIDIMRESKHQLEEKIPIFNIIVDNITEKDIDTAYDIVGNKLNALVDGIDQERILNILEQYKEWKEYKNK